MANADSGLEDLAKRLADALGTGELPPSESMASVAGPGSGAAASASEGSASTEDSPAAQIEQLLAGSGAVGGAGEGSVNTADSATAQMGQILAGGGAVGGASEGTAGMGDSAAAQIGQLLAGGGASEGSTSTADAAATLTATVEQLRSIEQVQAGAAGQDSSALNSSSQSNSGGSSALDTIGSVAASVFEDGLGLGPLMGGLASLFGGSGGSTTPPPLSTYTAPESVQFEGDVNRSANTTDWGGSGGTQSGASLSTGAQITVQVNAMDSQSFLDHSQDIANAVRQAMLNSNSLNDVVNDL